MPVYTVLEKAARQITGTYTFQPCGARKIFQLAWVEPHPYVCLRVAQRLVSVARVIE